MLFDCHSIARDVDGLHADEALDEICKVIYTKIFDERSTTKKPVGEPFRFQTMELVTLLKLRLTSACCTKRQETQI